LCAVDQIDLGGREPYGTRLLAGAAAPAIEDSEHVIGIAAVQDVNLGGAVAKAVMPLIRATGPSRQ
jgi:hypothetical protein